MAAISALVICMSPNQINASLSRKIIHCEAPVNSLTAIPSHRSLFSNLRTISAARAFMGALLNQEQINIVPFSIMPNKDAHVNNLQVVLTDLRWNWNLWVVTVFPILADDAQYTQHGHVRFTLQRIREKNVTVCLH